MTASTMDAYGKLYSQIEDALGAGLTYAQVLEVARAAHSSLQADRLTAEDLERPDPYPHLAESADA